MADTTLSRDSRLDHIEVAHGAGKRRSIPHLLVPAVLLVGALYTALQLNNDLSVVHTTSYRPFLLLGVALLIALGFEFVNGFHDTANAVATVIYTHSLPPTVAVVWSGMWNLFGVLASTGAVAYGIIALLPVELILQVGSSAGFAMVFALLVAAILWNLGTWYLGLPASSSHTLIGSIIGVGVANELLSGPSGTSGVDWAQAISVGKSLLFSPLVGFFGAALLLLIARAVIRSPRLYKAPEGSEPPPLWIRGLLILTCTGVSFAHGSNDGQKGMGLIMLILIGTVPTAYALNRTISDDRVPGFLAASTQAVDVLERQDARDLAEGVEARKELVAYVGSREQTDTTVPALKALIGSIAGQVRDYGSVSHVPAEQTTNLRNDMYLADEALRRLQSRGLALSEADADVLTAYRGNLDDATKFIPTWVKVSVAIALGLGTMVGWRRIVVTVGERIGKTHLSYGQGAAAELVAMTTIGAADIYGLPVSTTHVLSSGVAGTMAANRSGLQFGTVRSIALAWVLTLPMAMLLAGLLYALFLKLF